MEGAAMFDVVLVPLDGSQDAEDAISVAAEEAARHGCPLVLIHVVPRPEALDVQVPHGGPAHWRRPWSPRETQSAVEAGLGYLREVILRHGLAPDTELVAMVGDPFRQVELETARRSRPLVVLAGEWRIGPPARTTDEPMRRLLLSGTASMLRIQGPREVESRHVVPVAHHPAIESGGTSAAIAAWG
jgi:nucleotide-binding universal stress UspA family protein